MISAILSGEAMALDTSLAQAVGRHADRPRGGPMQESRITLQTSKSVQECASTFRQAVRASYGPARRALRGLAIVRGSDDGGVEFFTPKGTPFSGLNGQVAWQAGAWVPGFSKMYGATRMAVHIYISDHGGSREVQLVGPHGTGDKGSTERLLRNIAAQF